MLVVNRVTKSYGDVIALQDVSVELPPAGYAVIVGQSGSGKTTLLRAIAGHITVDAGRITLGDRDITNVPPHERPISSVFQQYALFPHLTVAQNIAFGLQQQSVAGDKIRSRVAEMLDLVGLVGMEKRKPTALSGGQQQRVALARALAVRPDAVMLDEPLGALDPELRTTMRQELARVQRESGVLFIHVSHDREEAWTLADHLLVMKDGRLIGAGSLDELRANPGDASVARVLGYDNVIVDPDDPDRQIAFAPEHVVSGDTWRGQVLAVNTIGVWLEREIRLENGSIVRQREIAEAMTDPLDAGAELTFGVKSDAIRVVMSDEVHRLAGS